jgi:hypothetical protein
MFFCNVINKSWTAGVTDERHWQAARVHLLGKLPGMAIAIHDRLQRIL